MEYPTVDFEFICQQIQESTKVINSFKIGSTLAFIIDGSKPITERTIIVRATKDNTISLERASALAFKYKFLGPLLAWLEQNRNWKDGGYFTN